MPLSGFKYLKRLGISQIKVYGRVGKSVILVGKKAQKGKQMHFTVMKKSRKRSGFVIYSNFKYSAFTAVRYVKGVPLLSKMVYKRVRGWT